MINKFCICKKQTLSPPCLQFLAKKQRIVRQADLAGLGVGQKDMTKGAFQVWTELLQKKVRGQWGRLCADASAGCARLLRSDVCAGLGGGSRSPSLPAAPRLQPRLPLPPPCARRRHPASSGGRRRRTRSARAGCTACCRTLGRRTWCSGAAAVGVRVGNPATGASRRLVGRSCWWHGVRWTVLDSIGSLLL